MQLYDFWYTNKIIIHEFKFSEMFFQLFLFVPCLNYLFIIYLSH